MPGGIIPGGTRHEECSKFNGLARIILRNIGSPVSTQRTLQDIEHNKNYDKE